MLKKALRYFLRGIEILFILALLWCAMNSELVVYGLQQANGQLKIVRHARPLSEVMQDPGVNDTIKAKLRYIEAVKRFAIDSLGLKESKNYTTLYDQHGKPILWVLTAAERYKLEPYQWKFPLLGKVGYKGFFEIERGKKARKE